MLRYHTNQLHKFRKAGANAHEEDEKKETDFDIWNSHLEI